MASSSFLIELWTEYSIGSAIVLTRLCLQLRALGFRGLKPDDYLVALAWALYTIEIPMAFVIILVTKGTNAGMTDVQRQNISAKESAARALGSKCFITGWLCYAGTVWILKLCVGFFFLRITEGLSQQRFVKVAMGYVLATWVTISLFLLCNCRPFHAYWQVNPNPGSKIYQLIHFIPATFEAEPPFAEQCTFEDGTPFILGLVLNLSSDIILMLVPIPIVIRARITLTRKVIVCLMFSAGFFVMVAATLRVVFFFTAVDPTLPAIWSCRETFVAFCVTNAMIIGPQIRKLWNRRCDDSAGSHQIYRSKPVELTDSNEYSKGGNRGHGKGKSYLGKDVTTVTASDSTEHIIESVVSTPTPGLVIQTQRMFQVSNSEGTMNSHNVLPSNLESGNSVRQPQYSVQVGR